MATSAATSQDLSLEVDHKASQHVTRLTAERAINATVVELYSFVEDDDLKSVATPLVDQLPEERSEYPLGLFIDPVVVNYGIGSAATGYTDERTTGTVIATGAGAGAGDAKGWQNWRGHKLFLLLKLRVISSGLDISCKQH